MRKELDRKISYTKKNGKTVKVVYFGIKGTMLYWLIAFCNWMSDDGTKICASVKYDEPRPVIYHRLLPNEESDYKFPLDVKSLLSDESNDCEWCGLSSDSWIIVEDSGNVRVWEYSSCEDFLGENSVCEKVNEKTYIEVAV